MSKALIPRQGTAITGQEREKFLDTLRKTFNVSRAAAAIGRNRTSLYKLREAIPEFDAAWAEVVEECLDDVEQIVYERALEGKQPVNNIFLLRHRRAHIYGEKVTVQQKRKVELELVFLPPGDSRPKGLPDGVVDAEEVVVLGRE